jgi:AcrR family transcriptional regulator
MNNNVSNPKYGQIIKTATELFIRYGIKRVTIEEICKSANVSKMTFYKFFSNKTELLKQILNSMMDEGFKFADNVMSQNIPFQEKARQNIKYKIGKIREYGGPFFEEIFRIPELQPFLMEMNKNNIKKILEIFNLGRKEGALRENITPEFYQYLLEHLLVMGDDEKLKKIFPDMSQRIEKLIDILFYGVFKKESNQTEE